MQVIRKRAEYDRYYIENWSMMLDQHIIFLTLFHQKPIETRVDGRSRPRLATG